MTARVALLAVTAVALSGCLATRLARPWVKAQVQDAGGVAVAGAEVVTDVGVEAVSDREGRFELPPRTFREWAWPGGEAPPVRLRFQVRTAGWAVLEVDRFNPFGGAGSPTVAWTLAPLTLTPLPRPE